MRSDVSHCGTVLGASVCLICLREASTPLVKLGVATLAYTHSAYGADNQGGLTSFGF